MEQREAASQSTPTSSSIKPILDLPETAHSTVRLFWGSVELFSQRPVANMSLFQQKIAGGILGQYFNFPFAKSSLFLTQIGEHKMKHVLKSASAACALLVMAAFPAAHAQTGALTKVIPEVGVNSTAVSGYWTPERFKAAQPMPMPIAKSGTAAQAKDSRGTLRSGQPASSDGQAPSEEFTSDGQQLFSPGPDAENLLRNEILEPQATGTLGAYYTSTRVMPLFSGAAAQYSADRAYPYRTVGKLFFTIGSTDYVCSASVIQRRVVVTAGHCVHSGSGGQAGFFRNWIFVPSYRDGTAPFGTWTPSLVTVTTTWATGGGTVPNAADYAMFVFADRALPPSGTLRRIGNVTGWLGWKTLSLTPNHTSKLGYPLNLDNGLKMQDITSESFRSVAPNNVEYGGDGRGGMSGGPFVQNFQTLAVNGGTGLNTESNRVVGVLSYGYISEAPKVMGASIPDSRWVNLWNTVCAGAGNCAP
jgi:V8-like Glu-specific endopeptidase